LCDRALVSIRACYFCVQSFPRVVKLAASGAVSWMSDCVVLITDSNLFPLIQTPRMSPPRHRVLLTFRNFSYPMLTDQVMAAFMTSFSGFYSFRPLANLVCPEAGYGSVLFLIRSVSPLSTHIDELRQFSQ
jgi:hypothetical protein